MHKQYRRTRAPRGFSFLDQSETQVLEEKTRHAQSFLKERGYSRVMPPAIDYPETFEVYEGDSFFKFRDRSGTELSLRNDVTVQVIKGFCNQLEYNRIESGVQRFYYTVPVFLDDDKGHLTRREIYQVGAEMIGLEEGEAIVELMTLGHHILKTSFDSEHIMLLGDINAYKIVEKHFGHDELRLVIRERNAPALAAILEGFGFGSKTAHLVARNLLFAPENLEDLESWQNFKNALQPENEQQEKILNELKDQWEAFPKILQQLHEKGVPVRWEPLLVRPSYYYTGLLFETYVPGLTHPPLRGGAYNDLISKYSNQNLPAAGFALDASLLVV